MLYTEDQLIKLANDNGLKIDFGAGIIYIKTNVSRWRLFHNYERVKEVWHENYRTGIEQYSTRRKFNNDYHKQKIKGTYEEVLAYIASHDRKMCDRKG